MASDEKQNLNKGMENYAIKCEFCNRTAKRQNRILLVNKETDTPIWIFVCDEHYAEYEDEQGLE